MRGGARAGRGRRRATGRRLRSLIEEALVDCYTEDEQHGAFLVMLDEHVARPFKARVVGEEVEVRGFDWDGTSQGIVAICRRKGRHYRVNVTALEWLGRPPTGAIWFDAYRAWLRGAW
ncbi:MAG: calcium-binding protein [Candidatus Rokuibacteriota bacterium]